MSEGQERPATLSEQRLSVHPVLRTNRILLSQPNSRVIKIRVDYSLNLDRPLYHGVDEIASYLNSPSGQRESRIVFLVVDRNNEDLIGDLADPTTARRTLMNQVTDERFLRSNTRSGYQRVPLHSVLTQNMDRNNYTTVTEVQNSTQYEVHGQIEIEYKFLHDGDEPLSKISVFDDEYNPRDPVSFNVSRLHLVGFIETPYLRHGDYDAQTTPQELMTIPLTEITYDLLLSDTSDQVTSTALLRPPSKREIFYVNDNDPRFSEINLRPYSGPAHYHEEPVDGYVGWMAGHAAGAMGPKLDVRIVPNHKVTVDAPPWNSEPIRPSIGQLGVYEETGSSLQSMVKSFLSPEELNTSRFATEMLKASIAAATRNNRSSFVEPWSRTHTWITKDGNEDDQNLDSSYNCIIGVKFLEILENHSPFGRLISHFKQIAVQSIGQRNPRLRIAKSMLKKFVDSSGILNLSIVRRRLDQRPYNNNDQDTKTYHDFEENQKNKIIVQTSDAQITGASVVFPARWDTAELEEVRVDFEQFVNLDQSESTQQRANAIERTRQSSVADGIYATRSFLLRDYELFYNLDYGKYTYDIDLAILDGSKSIVKGFRQDLVAAKQKVEILLEVLSSPIVRDTSGRMITGIYDYHNRRFYNVKPDLRQQTLRAAKDLIGRFRDCTVLLTGEDPISSDENFEEALAKCDPGLHSSTLDSLKYLITESDKSIKSLEKLLSDVFLESGEAASNNTNEIHVPNATGHSAPILHIRCNTGIVHDASDTLKMVADYGIFSSRTGDGALSRFIRSAQSQIAVRTLDANPAGGAPLFEDYGVTGNSNTNILNPTANIRAGRDLLSIDTESFLPIEFTVMQGRRLDVSPSEPMQFTVENPRVNTSGGSRPAYSPAAALKTSLPTFPNMNITRRSIPSFGAPIVKMDAPGSILKIKKSDFDLLASSERAIKESKILTMMQEDSHVLGAAVKSSAFDARFLSSTVGGMSNSFSGFDISSSSKDITSAVLNSIAIDSSLLSDGVKSSLAGTMVDSQTEDDFLRKIDENYKELRAIKDTLKGLYNVFSRLVTITKISLPASFDTTRSKDLFENGEAATMEKPELEITQTPFQKKAARFVEFSKMGDRKTFNPGDAMKRISDLSGTAAGPSEVKVVKLFKLEQVGVSDNIPNVNNALMMELN